MAIIANNYILQKTFINFDKRQFTANQTKTLKNDQKNMKKCTILGLITLNKLLTLNFNALWAFLVYSVFKYQSHKNHARTSYKKDRAPIQSNSWIVIKWDAILRGIKLDYLKVIFVDIRQEHSTKIL